MARRRPRPRRARPRRRGAAPDRHLRRAARRAGPRAGRRAARSGSASSIWPHGRWRLTCAAGPTTPAPRGWPTATTRCSRWPPRCWPRRAAAERHGTRRHRRQGARAAERGQRDPVVGDRLAGRPRPGRGRRPVRVVADVGAAAGAAARRGVVDRRRPTFDAALRDRLAALLDAPGPAHRRRPRRRDPRRPPVPTAMLFVRNPTGVSHSPAEHAERGRLRGRRRGARPGDRGAWRDAPTGASTPGSADAAGAPASRVDPVDDGRIAAVERGRRPRARRRPAARRRAARASPTRTRTPSTGPCAGGPTTAAAPSGPGASGCTPSPPGSTPTATSRSPAPPTPRWRWPGSPRRRVPLPAPPPGGGRYADPNAMARGADPGRRRRRHPADPARHLLPRRRLDGTGHLPLDGVQTRFSDGDADAWAARVGAAARARRGCGSAPRCTRCARCPPASCRAVAAAAAGRPLHVHLSEQPAENEACLAVYGRTPTALLADRGRARPRTPPPCTPPTSPATTSPRSAAAARRSASARPPSATSPTASAPFRRLRDAGSPLCLGSDQHAVIDLLGEAPALEARRAAGHRRARPVPPGRAARRAHRRRPPRAGLAGRRPDRAGARADLVAVRLDTPAHRRAARPTRS